MINAWSYMAESDPGDIDLDGYDVEAEDGHIGTVEEASHESGDSFIVVDMGRWIFGKKRLIPARFVRQVNPSSQKVFVSVAKRQVDEAPDYDRSRRYESDYRDSLVTHFAAVRR